MKHFLFGLLLALAAQSALAAGTTISLQRVVNDVATNNLDMQKGTNGAAWVYPAYLTSGEDDVNNVVRVEGQFSYAVDDADIVLADAGYLHTFQCWPEDATAEAGSVAIRDADSAGTGTIIWQDTIAAAAYVPGDHNPKVPFDYNLTTGLVIDFTTTTDVFCTVSYR